MTGEGRRGTRVFSGSSFEKLAGYARAVILPDPGGDWVMVSGTTGFDYAAGTIADDTAEQTHQAFRNIAVALEEAGSSFVEAVRVRVYAVSEADFQIIAPIVGEYMGGARPANTSVISALVDPRMKVEIEVTTRKAPDGAVRRPHREEGRG